MPNALFMNGIYQGVFDEILAAQEERGGGEAYIHPYKNVGIRMLREHRPSPMEPIRLYASTTENLSQICYTAEIIGWEDKRELSELRRSIVRAHLEKYQPGEVALFNGTENVGQKGVNLITIRNLRQPNTLHSTAILHKVSDELPLAKRSRSGGWSEVYDVGDLAELAIPTLEE